jgi:hypothetical protein
MATRLSWAGSEQNRDSADDHENCNKKADFIVSILPIQHLRTEASKPARANETNSWRILILTAGSPIKLNKAVSFTRVRNETPSVAMLVSLRLRRSRPGLRSAPGTFLRPSISLSLPSPRYGKSCFPRKPPTPGRNRMRRLSALAEGGPHCRWIRPVTNSKPASQSTPYSTLPAPRLFGTGPLIR